MVILIVHNVDVPVLKAECYAPVAGDPDCPVVFEVAFEPVKPGTWKVRIFRVYGFVKKIENQVDLCCVLRL